MVQMELDAHEKGLNLSYEQIKSILSIYFSSISTYMVKGALFEIDYLGIFSMKVKEIKRRHQYYINMYNKHIKRTNATSQKRFHNERIKARYDNVMAERKKLGLELWSYEEFQQITKRKEKK